jgi:hypothetical protein
MISDEDDLAEEPPVDTIEAGPSIHEQLKARIEAMNDAQLQMLWQMLEDLDA